MMTACGHVAEAIVELQIASTAFGAGLRPDVADVADVADSATSKAALNAAFRRRASLRLCSPPREPRVRSPYPVSTPNRRPAFWPRLEYCLRPALGQLAIGKTRFLAAGKA